MDGDICVPGGTMAKSCHEQHFVNLISLLPCFLLQRAAAQLPPAQKFDKEAGASSRSPGSWGLECVSQRDATLQGRSHAEG